MPESKYENDDDVIEYMSLFVFGFVSVVMLMQTYGVLLRNDRCFII